MMSMATIRISEAEAIRDIAGLLARAYTGEEIIIEKDAATLAVVMRPAAAPMRRSIEECIALIRRRSSTKTSPAMSPPQLPPIASR
jgi:antitoxin (DNA-binding transcriptional repressor) of toxin-antitoxin stability system